MMDPLKSVWLPPAGSGRVPILRGMSHSFVLSLGLIACMPLGVALASGHSSQGEAPSRPSVDQHDQAGHDLQPLATGVLVVRTDFDRNGVLNEADDAAARVRGGTVDLRSGALVLPNLDDDNKDGLEDARDGVVNGPDDALDLAPVEIRVDPSQLRAADHMAVTAGGGAPVRVFLRGEGGWKRVLDQGGAAAHRPEQTMRYGVEALRFAGPDWNGSIELTFSLKAADGSELARQKVVLRVAPWIALPNSAPTRRVYAAEGVYANARFLEQAAAALKSIGSAGVPLSVHKTSNWREMWVQDTFEMGFTQLPGQRPMHVVLNGLRGGGADTFGPRLLAPGVGLIRIGQPRGLSGGDQWADWMGNLEVTHPTEAFPFGRVYYGKNLASGVTLHPDVLAFVRAQGVQEPFWLDTSYLTIKHVDEILNFVPGGTGHGYLIVGSPAEAARHYDPDFYGPYNRSVEAIVQANIERVMQATGITENRVVRLPLYLENGHGVWSNPVNAVYVNGKALVGQAGMPEPIRSAVAARYASTSTEVVFVDDQVYQENLGNVHCATNTMREPPRDFVERLGRLRK